MIHAAPEATPARPGVAAVVLRAEGLVRRFDERVAVDGVGFEVRRGETYGLLGSPPGPTPS